MFVGNYGGTNCNPYAQTLIILRALTYWCTFIVHQKLGQPGLLCRSKLPVETKLVRVGFYKQAEPHSPCNVCFIDITGVVDFNIVTVTIHCTFLRQSHMLACFYHESSYASAVLAVVILSICPSICPSCMLCDKTKQCTADILIPHKRAITLVFWHQQWLAGEATSPSIWNLHSQ